MTVITPIPREARDEEYFEYFNRGAGRNSKQYVQYDYRDENGNLFTCVRPTLEECHKARDKWLKRKSQ